MAGPLESKRLALVAGLILGVWVSNANAVAAQDADDADLFAEDTPSPAELAREAELEAAEQQALLATGLYVSGAVLAGGGLASVIGGSVGTLTCGPMADCDAAALAIAFGGIAAGVGLVLFIVATFVDQGATERRRRVLREQMAFGFAPLPGGGALTLRYRF